MDQEKLQKSYKESINIALIYLQGSVDELAKIGDLKDKMTDKELNLYAMMLETRIAYLLDLTHRSFPVAFDLFPDAHENLKNCYIIFKRFEKAGKLKPCECDYCKEHPVDPKDLEGVKTPEEVKAELEKAKADKKDEASNE
jgi:hypothetical protein